MVIIHQQAHSDRQRLGKRQRRGNNNVLGGLILFLWIILAVLMILWITAAFTTFDTAQKIKAEEVSMTSGKQQRQPPRPQQQRQPQEDLALSSSFDASSCPVTSISSLSEAELHPSAEGSTRHMVTPPDGGPLSLVCCSTTKGYLSLLIHKVWAPIGVERLLDMVRTGYFDSKIPLFRCIKDACQFGLAGNPNVTKHYDKRLKDDPMWMPPGKDHRENAEGVKRYPEGFLTYAGAGPNSRSNQLVLTLRPNPFMGGGSPWEVPLGELIGSKSFETIRQFYVGYGHNHVPGQPVLRREGYSERVQKEWPLMDLILGCRILDEREEG